MTDLIGTEADMIEDKTVDLSLYSASTPHPTPQKMRSTHKTK